jgi:hypothetical protein
MEIIFRGTPTPPCKSSFVCEPHKHKIPVHVSSLAVDY